MESSFGSFVVKHVKKILGTAVVLPLGFCIWWSGMNYAGYCHKEGRFLSDEEKIHSAIRYVLAGYPPSISNVEVIVNDAFQRGPSWAKPKNTIKYKDVDEFQEINPNCCKLSMVIAEGVRSSFIDRIAGYFSTFVIVRYKVRYFDDNNVEKHNDGGQAVAIKNCGQAW